MRCLGHGPNSSTLGSLGVRLSWLASFTKSVVHDRFFLFERIEPQASSLAEVPSLLQKVIDKSMNEVRVLCGHGHLVRLNGICTRGQTSKQSISHG